MDNLFAIPLNDIIESIYISPEEIKAQIQNIHKVVKTITGKEIDLNIDFQEFKKQINIPGLSNNNYKNLLSLKSQYKELSMFESMSDFRKISDKMTSDSTFGDFLRSHEKFTCEQIADFFSAIKLKKKEIKMLTDEYDYFFSHLPNERSDCLDQ